MTDTIEQTPATAPDRAGDATGAADTAGPAKRPTKKGSLSSMLLPELQQLAAGMGISTTKMKKSDLVAAIQTARSGATATATENGARSERGRRTADAASAPSAQDAPATGSRSADRASGETRDRTPRGGSTAGSGARTGTRTDSRTESTDSTDSRTDAGTDSRTDSGRSASRDGATRERDGGNRDGGNREVNRQNRPQSSGGQGAGSQSANTIQSGGGQNQNNRQDEDDYDGNRRRGRRYRDRRGRNRDRVPGQGGVAGNNDLEPTVSDDDVLVPVAGILDAIEDKNTWFVRTSGYFASPEDIYVANSYVRRYGLRRGDAVTGAVKQQVGERREKYNPLVRLDTVNGVDPEQSKNRIEFTKLTPLYPQERLRLETEPHILTTRVIDLVMPIGKGQRALIVSPPKAGKTMVLQSIANAIATNNPEVHLMVVLIDERPEEVTDMQRSVKGEVIASTFDRRPQDHITVAELSIERAKRLVEMGHDVVVLLDSITRLGRAYNLGAPASGRILSGGVDSTALYPPKRFLGAARNIENGGSLTILATALVETGSAGDTVIFEEFKGTGNAELKLDRKIADKRVFPAVDVDQSSTRKEEILLSPDELAVTIKLRRVLHALEAQQAIDLLLDRLKKTRTNIEFLMQIAKTTPGQE
ncbi:MAG: transcription termination factor Rho [Pseudonocardiales bacterium]|nr:transcription termination factor Rho [Pseudonocardiales bacterium]